MTSTEQRSSKDLVQRLRRLSGGAKVVAGLAADEIERLQRQVDTLSRELAKFVTAHQQKADRLASEPRTAQPVAYRVEFEDGAVELWDGSAIPYEPLFGAEVTPLYAHAPPPSCDHDELLRRCYDELPNPDFIADPEKEKRVHMLLRDLATAIKWGEKCKHNHNAALCAQCERDRLKASETKEGDRDA